MFEISIACRYILPRRQQLSISIISLISILVISLVVWLVLVFFSVTEGLEKSWIEKSTAFSAPIKISPTEKYYSSYYYLVDGLSDNSSYELKSITQKKNAPVSDPYDPSFDQQLTESFPSADLNVQSELIDPVKLAFSAIKDLKHSYQAKAAPFEIVSTKLKLNTSRQHLSLDRTFSYTSYLGTFYEKSPFLKTSLLPLSDLDIINLKKNIAFKNITLADTPTYQALEPSEATQRFTQLAASLGKKNIGQKKGSEATLRPALRLWLEPVGQKYQLNKDIYFGSPVILPKSYKDAGVLVGDFGSISYFYPTASAIQENFLPVYVAGFYDAGIIPTGGKFIWAEPTLINSITNSYRQSNSSRPLEGINLFFPDYSQADKIKAALLDKFNQLGISQYWRVETFRDFEYTKEIMQELKSQKNLFMLISVVIVIVACSNIISMLIILVNDKKSEIAILRAMGASSRNIAFIFALAGASIGFLGSLLGISLSIITLANLDYLVNFMSWLQGSEMFNENLYGKALPNSLSLKALTFIFIATTLTSLVTAIIPAIKACLVKPSVSLKGGGS